jgi:hypothetical protein
MTEQKFKTMIKSLRLSIETVNSKDIDGIPMGHQEFIILDARKPTCL